ncbi:FAD/NAD(P)-binding domain-containing protein [Aspergillus aculeatinus CBS 121060]|uniref:FAD/NAD(P)-binding domain-containing protein n=1 Tax=Aspergillus aculeatinus CBS 121060 TaxID=1448322 RepID=A0ACD1GZY0_9EURO|nr:FAD/NAD(P)-binding domain-containing protein [Aspergillus aculeatinus CBS 121060]RAH66741.1 FAD/NAD(P)-binding domain-containing protein [Aspergillus aculeatinus CBS 121060]
MHTILSLFLTSLLVTIVKSTPPTLAGDIDIIKRDVAITGGGAGGIYCAISLQDQGKSVIVIEKKDRLGGHVETYVDPGTGIAMDYGFALFENTSVVNDYFARFDIPLVKIRQFNITWSTYDFRTGKTAVPSYNPSREEVLAAFATYFAQLARYPELEQGIFLPSPIPEDLYMPFGRFVDKYKIHAAVPTMFLLNAGVGDLLSNAVLEVFRALPRKLVEGVLTSTVLTPANHTVIELYRRAEAELSSTSSLFLSAEVVETHQITLLVRTPTTDGKLTLIQAKRLLIAIPPNPALLDPWLRLTPTEHSLFTRYISTGLYVGLVNGTRLPPTAGILNLAPNHTMYSFPYLPDTEAAVRHHMLDDIRRIQRENPDRFPGTGAPAFVAFAAHAPYNLQVSGEDIKNGFYERLYALQGEMNTFWTGSAWAADISGDIWKFSRGVVLPMLVGEL